MLGHHHDDDAGVYVISVAAELAGMHPQTLRQYDRLGLVVPSRFGASRRYSVRDLVRLRLIGDLVGEGVGLAGVHRVLELQAQLEQALSHLSALQQRLAELEDELDMVRAVALHAVAGATVAAASQAGAAAASRLLAEPGLAHSSGSALMRTTGSSLVRRSDSSARPWG